MMNVRIALFAVVISLSAACGVSPEDATPPLPNDQRTDVALAATNVINAWTASTSEEFAPIACGAANLITRMRCTGSYCDNVGAFCQSVSNVTFGDVSWRPYFSEEGTNNQSCPLNSWMTGLVCRGGNCDDIAIQCTAIRNRTTGTCRWADRTFSEEFPNEYQLPAGWFARGLACTGSRCDNLRVLECQMN